MTLLREEGGRKSIAMWRVRVKSQLSSSSSSGDGGRRRRGGRAHVATAGAAGG